MYVISTHLYIYFYHSVLSCVSICPPPIIFLLPEERASGFHLVQITYNEFSHPLSVWKFFILPLFSEDISLGIEFQFGSIFFQHFEGIIQWSLGFHCHFIAAPLKVLFLFLITFSSFSSYLILTSFTILFQVVKLLFILTGLHRAS